MKFSQDLLASSYRNLNATRAQVPPASAQLLQLTVDHMNPSNNLNNIYYRHSKIYLVVVSSVSLSLSHWYPGSGVVLDCIDS